MAYTAINDPEAHFQTVLWTGNGSANNAITLPGDTDMQPDLVWIANRDATDSHCVFDAVRGATEVLHSDTTAAEATDADTLDSFTSDGFQVDADVKVNTNTEKYVAWCWKANGTGSSNTDGLINTAATSANTTSGFSIVKYVGDAQAGQTVGHGLGAVPKLMIVRNLIDVEDWVVYHHLNTAAPATDYLILNTNDTTADLVGIWNDTAPTSSVFSVGTHGTTNGPTDNTIAYCFAEKQGFSKFGSYTGNGNASGPFIYTGFRPAWLMAKRTDSADSWWIADNKRLGYNVDNNRLYADLGNETENTADRLDLLSNGFKIVATANDVNASGGTFIYMAFAEAPFVNSKGVPCNAR